MRTSPPDPNPFSSRTRVGLAAVALLAGLAYANSLAGGFVWDDRILILAGRLPRVWERLGEILTRDFFHRAEVDDAYGYWRPLVTLSYAWDYTWWRLEPFGYHLTNVLLHVANSVLAGRLLLRCGLASRPALLAAALFAVHPVHTESVAWIAGRTDLLAFFLALLALDLRERRGSTVLAPLALLAGLLAKEMAAVAVAWAFLIDLTAQRRTAADAFRRCLPLVLTLLGYACVRFLLLDVRGPGAPDDHTPLNVALSLGPTVLRYLGWMAWPWAPSAYVVHPYVESVLDPRLWISWVALTALACGFRAWTRHAAAPQALWLALAMLGAGLLPLIGLWRAAGPPDMGLMMAERFTYFPSLPFLALVGLGLDTLWRHRNVRLRIAAATLAAGTVVASLAATIDRNRIWRDEQTFLDATLATAPQATLLWGRMVQFHLENGNTDAAARALREATAAGAGGRAMLGIEAELLQQQGRLDEAIAAQERFARGAAMARGPALNNLAVLYRRAGRATEARTILERLVADGLAYADVYANLAALHRDAGDVAAARRMYEAALHDRPDDLRTAGALVSLEVEAGRPQAAEAVYETMLRFHPGDRRLRNNIALLRAGRGDDDGAASAFAALIADHPDYASARVNYAQVLFRLGRRDEALTQLRAVEPLVRGTELEAVVRRQLQESAPPP
jgi:tetratricopeptide (TPR) repeat protein